MSSWLKENPGKAFALVARRFSLSLGLSCMLVNSGGKCSSIIYLAILSSSVMYDRPLATYFMLLACLEPKMISKLAARVGAELMKVK